MLKSKLIGLILLNFIICINVLASPASEYSQLITKPKNINQDSGLKYSYTKEFQERFQNKCEEARKFCTQYIESHPDSHNLAIVSDLDETLLDNRACYENNKVFTHKVFYSWVDSASAPVLKPTYEFLSDMRKRGYAIFFITGRRESSRIATTFNLIKDNIAYDGLYLKPDDFKGSASIFKTNTRKKIEELGYEIVENIGDQVSDLYGGHSIDCTKLPNRIYFVP